MDFKQFIHPILTNLESKTYFRTNGGPDPVLKVLNHIDVKETREPRFLISKSFYRKTLTFKRLEEIISFQKRKRVNCLKEQMSSVTPSSTTIKKKNEQQQLFLFSPDKDGKFSAFSPLSSTAGQYNPNSISSYFDIMDRSAGSPSSLAVVTGCPPSSGQHNTTLSCSFSPLTPIDRTALEASMEKERKEENLQDYAILLSSLENLSHDLIDSCDEMKLSPSKGTLKPFDPIHYQNLRGKATTRKDRKERRNPADRDDNEDDDEEEDEEDKRRYAITTPKIRYGSSKKRNDYFAADRLQRKKKFQERRQRRGEEASIADLGGGDDDGYDTSDDENDDRSNGEEEEKGNHRPKPLRSPSSFSSPSSPTAASLLKRTSLNPLPFLSEEIFWELRISKSSLSIMDSKIFFFQQILWRLTFGVNNTSDSYYYFFLSPAEKLKSFLSLKIDFNLYPSSNEANLASLTSPGSAMDGGYGGGGGVRTKLTSLSSLTSHSMTTPASPSVAGGGGGGDGGGRVHLSPTKKGGLYGSSASTALPYSRKSSQNFSFPVEFTVSRGYERFISKEDLKHYLDDRSSCNSTTPQTASQFFSSQKHHHYHQPLSPVSSSSSANGATSYYYLKLSVVISTNVGPNGELIGCVNL
jgi:hypothetical protein